MKGWLRQLAGVVLVMVFALGIGGFILLLRAQQTGLASSLAAANIKAVSPPDGATNVPVSGDITVQYVTRPSQYPVLKLEPVAGVILSNGRWEGSSYVIEYAGLRDSSLYHVELDQDSSSQKGEHKQIKVRWSFRTGSAVTAPTSAPSAAPSTQPTPTSTANAMPDLVWYRASDGVHSLDWNGKPVRNTTAFGNLQSPDGLRLYNGMTPSTQVFDVYGNLVGEVQQLFPMMWADDSSHFCGIGPPYQSGPKSLILMSLDGSDRSFGLTGLQAAPTQQLTLGLAACSELSGRAVVTGWANGYIWSMALVSLRDGSIIYQRRYPNPIVRLIASHDGEYVAEQLAGPATGKPYTLIRQLPSGNQVGQLSGVVVSGFSWDGSLVAGGIGTSTQLTGAEVIHWQDNQVLWNACGCPSPWAIHILAQPGGGKVAVMAIDQHQLGTLTLLDASGRATPIPLGGSPAQPFF